MAVAGANWPSLCFDLPAEAAPLMSTNDPWTPAGLRLLVVDDNAAACEIAAGMALELGVGEVVKASDVDTALRRSAEAITGGRPFDIVLVDARMPGRDGIDAVRSLMDLHSGRPTAILMTTAFGREELLERLAEAHLPPLPVLLKPVAPSALHAALVQALGEMTARMAPADEEGDYEAMFADARSHLQGMRVLLVEDNDISAELATDLLQRAGIEVTLALDGAKALAALAQIHVDVVLMDCQMPVMDGYAATRVIRADRRFDGLPVIAMTANAMQGDREEVLRVGMDDHIAKPIEVQDLFDTLIRWRQGRRA